MTDDATAGGIRPRGADSHRLETFVDAAFAFALTLLVISFDAVPTSYAELLLALKSVPPFMASFAIIVMLWIAHRNWSRRYGLQDAASVMASLALILIVMVYVYPLRAMMATTFHHLTGGWVPADFRLTSVDEVRGLFTIYGLGFASTVGCIVLLYLRALSRAPALGLSPYERALTRLEVVVWCIVAGVGLLSVLLAQLLPAPLLGWAGWVYCLLAVVTPLTAAILARRAERLRGAQD